MKRSLTFLDGNRSGESQLLSFDSGVVLLGRSSKATVRLDDPRTSRFHLELLLGEQVVVARNRSSNGFLLNDQLLTGTDEAELADGDILALGETRFRFDEIAEPPPPAVAAVEPDDPEHDDDETRFLEEPRDREIGKRTIEDGDDAEDGGTRVIENSKEGPILSAKDLPSWRPPPKHETSGTLRARLILGLLVVSGIGGAALAHQRGARQRSDAEIREYRDEVTGKFSLRLPSRWSTVRSEPGISQWTDADRADGGATITARAERDPLHADFGVALGFDRYLREAEKQYEGFELLGYSPMTVNDAATLHYGFRTTRGEGLGLFVLDGETRLVIEGIVPAERAAEQKPRVIEVLETFRLTTGRAQVFIDYPVPDADMKRTAVTAVAEIEERVADLVHRGDALFDQRSVKPDNLHVAVESYRKALQWHLALQGESPSERFTGLVRKLRIVSLAFREAVRDQVFDLRQSRSLGDRSGTRTAALQLMQMVPNRTSPEHIEAQTALRDIQATERRFR